MRISLIITAAGLSARFLKSLPVSVTQRSPLKSKLFFDLGGQPVLERTLNAFKGLSQIKEIVIAVHPRHLHEAKIWAKRAGWLRVKWVAGGKTRAESVLSALKKTSAQNQWVMVHDGARPFVCPSTIQKMMRRAPKYDAFLLAKRVVPTIKKISKKEVVINTVDREALVEAETPQIIRREMLVRAYRKLAKPFSYTDEAGLVEALGGRIGVYLHTDWNPKLTHFSDYKLACAQFESAVERRVGKGYDIHRLVPRRRLWIGGIKVPFEKGSLGHSDGDALLHSITDAVLGALGLGDIGDWFSDTKAKYKNIASSRLLFEVLEKARKMGWQVEQMDSNVILEKPKLGLNKLKIRKNIAKLLKLPLERVSVKARTSEGMPPIGTSEAWACESLVMMRKGK